MPVVGSSIVAVFGCYRCGHSWVPIRPEVRMCPRCKSSLWDVPRLRASRPSAEGFGIEEVLGSKRSAVRSLFRKHRAKDPRVFGSVARHQAGAKSDIDFLVRFEPGATLFDRIRLRRALQELLGREVDLADEETLHWLAKPEILSEARRV